MDGRRRGRRSRSEGEAEREREREGRSAGQEWFSWKLAFCTLGKCCSLSAGRALSSPWVGDSSPDVNHISAHLQLICPCHLQYPPSLWWSGKEGREGETEGRGGDGRESFYCSLSVWMSSLHLLHTPVGQSQGGGREEILLSVQWPHYHMQIGRQRQGRGWRRF